MNSTVTYRIHLLLPARAEAYLYDHHRIVGTVADDDWGIVWWEQPIPPGDYIHAIVEGDTPANVEYSVRYQRDRLASGLYTSWVSPLQEVNK